jgi:hypothetical protein
VGRLSLEPVRTIGYYLGVFGPIFLAGVSVAGGIGLVVEAARGRSPERWGVGRRVWAIAALYTFAISIRSVAVLLSTLGDWDDPNSADFFVERWRSSCSDLALLLVVSWLTARLARLPPVSGADAREWSGRFLAGALLIQSMIDMATHLFPES